ncbi:MAG: nuclear transport factor 2 family protein [Pirellulaceae bacterium]|jgi:hypothetical protein|nr:nuclear transport factor 2 family protein [Pirellulaceae bacterium]MDP7015743.1 nuclear transport factor 2 family protein [Pirellulaceae bacterium]
MNDLKQFLRDLNQAWQDQRFDDLGEYFHPAVTMMAPGSSSPMVGAESMVASYREFTSMCTVHSCDIGEITLYEYPGVTFAHLRFEIDYELDDERSQAAGVELYAIDTSGAKPQVVYRTQIQR